MGEEAAQGALDGAVAGSAAGPVGSLIGATYGAISGLLSGSAAKKERRRREEQERQHREEMAKLNAKIAENDRRMREAQEKAQRAERQRHEEKQRAAQAMAEAKAQHQTEMREQKEAEERTRKQQLVQSKRRELSEVQTRLDEKNAVLSVEEKQLEEVESQVSREEKEIEEFKVERMHPNCRVLVTMGVTGHGKSTVCNRLTGDTSEEGDGPNFRVSEGFESETTVIKKKMALHRDSGLHLAVVDTPGADDSRGRDRQFTMKLIKFLRGSGGVNRFLLFFDMNAPRFSQSFKSYLLECHARFGNEFWDHVVIIATKADTKRPHKIPGILQRVQNKFRETLVLPDTVELPCIPFGHDNYREAINELMRIVPRQRFNCDAIRSPIDELRQERDLKAANVRNLQSVRNAVLRRKNAILATIRDLERELR